MRAFYDMVSPMLMQTDIAGTIIWFVMLFMLFMLYPRLMLSQLIYKIEQSAKRMEAMTQEAIKITAKKSGREDNKKKIETFTDFFVVEPSSLDPYGIVRKIDQTIRSMENRFALFVESISSGHTYNEKQEVNYALRASMGLRQMSKIVRHYVEIAKKFKNLQVAMILQMQLPIIEKIAESELKGAEAFANGWPIGDSIGPLVAASYIDKPKEIAEDVVCGETVIENRKCFVLKAKGPAPHLGRIDEAITKIMGKNNIARFITIDAAQKLEGEKTGAVAEGTGFAMGGWGQREMIENMLLAKKKPLDSIVVKVGMTEAILPMLKAVFEALPQAREFITEAVKRAKKNEKLIIIGVGNSCGIADTKKCIEDVKKTVIELDKKLKHEQEKHKKGGWW